MNTVLIEAHPLVRTGIAHLLRTLKGVTGVTVVEPDEGMFDAIEAHADAGLLVIGLPLPHLDELSAIGEIMHRPHARHVVVLAESESPDIIRTLMQMGLSGYTLKHSPGEVIAASLELVLVGGQYIPASALLPESRLDGTPNPRWPAIRRPIPSCSGSPRANTKSWCCSHADTRSRPSAAC